MSYGQDTNYSWDTNSWIKNNDNKPMWQIWNKPIVTQENKDSGYLSSSSQSEEKSYFEMNLPAVQYVSSSTLVLPTPPLRICKNSFGQQHHLMLSVFAHFMVWICRLGIRKYR